MQIHPHFALSKCFEKIGRGLTMLSLLTVLIWPLAPLAFAEDTPAPAAEAGGTTVGATAGTTNETSGASAPTGTTSTGNNPPVNPNALKESDGVNLWCSYKSSPSTHIYNGTESKEMDQAAYEHFLTLKEQSFQYTDGTCLENNATTGFLEKADCTAAGKVLTEITEVFAPTITASENSKDQVVNVYSGLCCLVGVQDTKNNTITCKDVRRIYTKDFKSCKENAVNCEQRQWLVVSEGGLGMLKLVVKQFYTWAAFTVGTVAVVTMVWNGFRITTSGLSGDISEYKGKITSALSAIVLLFTSSLILYAINPDFFG